MTRPTLSAALLLALVAGCVGDPIADDGGSPGLSVPAALFQEWAFADAGVLGIQLRIVTDGHCEVTTAWRGRSEAYAVTGHLVAEGAFVEGAPPTFLPWEMATSADPKGGAPSGIAASGTVATRGHEVPISHRSTWTEVLRLSMELSGEATVTAGFAGLDPSVATDLETLETHRLDWRPGAQESALLRLDCDGPGRAAIVARTNAATFVDDWTLRGDGVDAGLATADGLRLATLSSTALAFEARVGLAFFAHLPTDPEKVCQVRLVGPNLDRTWTSPPSTWVLGLGDTTARATGPPGQYSMNVSQASATPFIVFGAAFYDFAPGSP